MQMATQSACMTGVELEPSAGCTSLPPRPSSPPCNLSSVNDDSQLPTRPDWADAFVADLRGRHPIPNLGVTGPHCSQGRCDRVLTHDFTHKTHVAIFGHYYPRSLPDWSSDDWITLCYA